jgi:hypothetical protein
LAKAGLTEFKKSCIVLWGRRTPEDGGAHYYGNHSNTGWAQVAEACLQYGYDVLLAGQYKEDPRKKHERMQNCRYIGEFYKNPYMPRTRQLCFFDHIGRELMIHNKSFLHVGMRSGGLDFYGLAGQPILYIAFEKLFADFETGEMKPKFDLRVGNLVEAFKESGIGTFNRTTISQPPKRWTTDNGTVAKRDEDRKQSNETKGFLPSDLDTMIGDIKRLLPS